MSQFDINLCSAVGVHNNGSGPEPFAYYALYYGSDDPDNPSEHGCRHVGDLRNPSSSAWVLGDQQINKEIKELAIQQGLAT